jgi:hypothetical protein
MCSPLFRAESSDARDHNCHTLLPEHLVIYLLYLLNVVDYTISSDMGVLFSETVTQVSFYLVSMMLPNVIEKSNHSVIIDSQLPRP